MKETLEEDSSMSNRRPAPVQGRKGATKPEGFEHFTQSDKVFWRALEKELAEMKQSKRQSQGIRQNIRPLKRCWMEFKRRREHKQLLKIYDEKYKNTEDAFAHSKGAAGSTPKSQRTQVTPSDDKNN